MGQIVSSAAKPKRCNLNKLSQLETPAAGEHILVSSDNSMNAAGQGNFDCYIEGDGIKAASELPLLEIDEGFNVLKETIEGTIVRTEEGVSTIIKRVRGTSDDFIYGYIVSAGPEITSSNSYFSWIVTIEHDGFIYVDPNNKGNVGAMFRAGLTKNGTSWKNYAGSESGMPTSSSKWAVKSGEQLYVSIKNVNLTSSFIFQYEYAVTKYGLSEDVEIPSSSISTIVEEIVDDNVSDIRDVVFQTEVTTYDNNSEGIQAGFFYRVDLTPPELRRDSRFASLMIPVIEGDVITSNSSTSGDTVGSVLKYADNSLAKITPTDGKYTITSEMVANGVVGLGLSWNLSNTPNITATKTSTIKLSDRVAALEEEIGGGSTQVTGIPANNAYKGVAPSVFREKLLNMTDDVNILLLGDSMTAYTNSGTELPNAANLPAGCQRNAITYQLWNLLCKNKPQCDRFDSEVNTFTESGTWALSDVTKQNNSVNSGAEKGEFSQDNCVYHEATTTGASVAFQWDLDSYEKLNFIHRISAYDGTTGVTISCTSGKVLVYDRTNDAWVEANGFVFSQTKTAGYKPDYEADWVRNVPLKMKRVDGETGSVTLTFTNTGSGTMYYWGTERYNWNIVRVTNIGRGGRHIELLRGSIKSEIEYRDVDLIVLQLPLWNELKLGGDFNGDWDARHINFLNYLKSKSNNFADFQVIVNVYHTQVYDWDGNKNLQFQANGVSTNPKTDLPSWQCEMKTISSLDNYDANVPVCNLVNELYVYAQSIGKTMQEILSNTEFTVDGTHCSGKGFAFYSGIIASMMYE